MNNWKMLTLVGNDQPGIVAKVSGALFDAGAQLGEAAMMRLGGNFTIMLMVESELNEYDLNTLVDDVVTPLGLSFQLQEINAGLFNNQIPNTRITVYGADHAGIVAKITTVLADNGFNILDLESGLAGSESQPIYVMSIEGTTAEDVDHIRQALLALDVEVEIEVSRIETMIG